MFCPELDTELETISMLYANLQSDFFKKVNAIEEWLLDCKRNGCRPTEEKPLFPKTPTAAQRSRKRPRVATILEDEEVADWTVKSTSPSPANRVRGSRAASKKAKSMMKELSLNKKLRRPSGFDEKRPDESEGPPKRQRRQQDSVASTSGASFRSARSTIMDEDETPSASVKATVSDKSAAKKSSYVETVDEDDEPLVTLKATQPSKKSNKPATVTRVKTEDSQDDDKPLVMLKATQPSKKSNKSATAKLPLDETKDNQDDDEPLITLKATQPSNKSSKPATVTRIETDDSHSDDAVKMRDSPEPPSSRQTRSVTTTTVTTKTTVTVVEALLLVPPYHASPVVRLVSLSLAEVEKMGRPSSQATPVVRLASLSPADVEKMGRPPRQATPVVRLLSLSPADVEKLRRPPPQQQDPVSVKKRVAAYEKEVLKPAAAAEPPVGRMTRTKTRAMVTAGGGNVSQADGSRVPAQKVEMSLLQKLARKSITKALRISREKDRRIQEADKENSFVGQQVSKPAAAAPLTAAKVRNTPFSTSRPTRMVLTSASANRMAVNQSASHTTLIQEKSSSNILSGLDSLLGSKPKAASLEEVEEKRREERRRKEEKEEEAQRKKKEMMDRKIEQQRRKREEKMQKVQASREALEREKMEREVRAEREKEEKARQAQEREERLREEMQRRKQQAMQKAVEIEERRRLDEAQRLARIRELEEEQRRLAAQKKREAEEVERQNLKRQQEEAALAAAEARERQKAAAEARERQKAAAEAKEKQKAAAEAKEKQRLAKEAKEKEKLQQKKKQQQKKADPGLDGTFVVPSSSTQAAANTTTTIERPPLKQASEWDYAMADISMGDSESEDEHQGQVPVWAGQSKLKEILNGLAFVPLNSYSSYFGSHPTTPNLVEVFSNPKLQVHKRTSSAVWKSMPRYSMMPSPK